MKPKIYAHCSYIGTTGYNNHTRDFFRELSKHVKLKVRNFSIGSSWNGYNLTPHDNEPYINDIDKSILYKQSLWRTENEMVDHDIYPSEEKDFIQDFNLILLETNHYFFYHNYLGPKIAYNVWESTLQPIPFFEKLKEFDELWVPSKWQRDCSITQGYDPNKIQVVPEGVDSKTFYPEKVDLLDTYKDGRFKFLLLGRWDYRKSTREIIETFLKTFNKEEPVDLVVSIDNPYGEQMDGFKTTEERLNHYSLIDDRIKIIHFPSREDYIKYLKTGHVFLSCARSEGWNLPLIEAMACGTPSIYSNCSGQLEFAEGLGLPVNILEERPASDFTYARFKMSELPGNYYEPDFEHLAQVMRYVYENYNLEKEKALKESEIIREKFSWEKVGEIGFEKSLNFYNKINSLEYQKNIPENKTTITYVDGPKVEITGKRPKEYFIEFLDEKDNVLHSSKISTNMWTTCNKKYYIKWKIRINGEIVDELDLTNKKVLISLESKSVGDTLAWTPYAVEFSIKHKCEVILSTFHNEWFENYGPYKNIKFIKPGTVINCDALYRIGWFRDENNGWRDFSKYPNQVNLIPLQQTATDILGLDYHELNFGVNFTSQSKITKNKYIVIGPQSTAGCKEWSIENWNTLSEMITKIGYDVVSLTSSPFNIKNTKNIYGKSWNEVFNILYNSELFIGLGSGLSWVNWALNKKTIMIAGFSEEGHEFQNNLIKISNNLCIKCWNDPVLTFDAGDWDWCPVYKNTERQHICQKSITPLQVFNNLGI